MKGHGATARRNARSPAKLPAPAIAGDEGVKSSEEQFIAAPARPKLSAPEMAVRAIQHLIRRKALRPGEPLPGQRDLARELNVSRTSLREALSTLEALGVLHTSAGRGTFVADAPQREQGPINTWRFSKRYDLREVYEFRIFMESTAVRLAAMNITDEELRDLKQLHAEFSLKLKASDFMASTAFDYEFHRLIMACSRNRVFVDIYQKFHKVFQETQMLPFSRKPRRWEAVTEHAKILQALEQRDGDAAAFYLEMHLLRATERIGIKLQLLK